MPGETLRQDLWPYSERNGVGAEADIARLFADPESPLSPEDKAAARDFASGLFSGRVGEIVCGASTVTDENGESRPISLKEVDKKSVLTSEQTFYLGYFTRPEGQQDRGALQLDPTGESIQAQLCDIERTTAHADAKNRKQIAKRSLDWYKAGLAEELKRDPSEDTQFVDEPKLSVNYAPDKLLGKIADLQAYRHFYREIKGTVKAERPVPLQQAKSLLLDLHIARVNNMVASLYSHAITLEDQLRLGPSNEKTVQYKVQLEQTLPLLRHLFTLEEGEAARDLENLTGGLVRRLDLVRNGAAWRGGPNASAVSEELESLAHSLEAEKGTAETVGTPQLPLELIEYMDTTHWHAAELKDFNEALLAEWGLLSEHATDWQEVDDRDGRAPDGRWQVIVTPRKDSLSVDSIKKVVFVPEKFDRNLSQVGPPAGALPVTAHELTHVLQAEYDNVLSKQVPLADIKGRRAVTMREMGGLYQERLFQQTLGRQRGVNLHYLRAFQVKEGGGNKLEATRASYESQKAGRELDEAADKALRISAADRTLRLYRHNGNDSQALDYAEQELIMQALGSHNTEEIAALTVAGGSFALSDSVKLHQFGLLELPQNIPHTPTEDVLRIFQQKYLPESIAKND